MDESPAPALPAAPQPIPGCERIGDNRRRCGLLMLLYALAVLPGVVLVVQFVIALVFLGLSLGASVHVPRNVQFLVLASALVFAYMGVLLFTYSRSKAIVLKAAGARPACPLESQLSSAVADLSRRLGVPQPDVYVIERAAPNVLAAGVDAAHSAIVATTGLLELLTPAEREAVLAHQFAHLTSLDTSVGTLVAAIIATLRLPWDIFRRLRRRAYRKARLRAEWGFFPVILNYIGGVYSYVTLLAWTLPIWSLKHWAGDVHTHGETLAWLMLLPVWTLLGAPLVATLFRQLIPRDREFLADSAAATITGSSDGIVRALWKLKGAASQDLAAHRALGHLFIVDPPAHALGVASETHPPVEERIARVSDGRGTVSPDVANLLQEAGARQTGRDLHLSNSPGAHMDSVKSNSASVGAQYRLLAPAVLTEEPKPGSRVLIRMPAGEQIVVFQKAGRFYQAVSEAGMFGYLRDDTPMKRLGAK